MAGTPFKMKGSPYPQKKDKLLTKRQQEKHKKDIDKKNIKLVKEKEDAEARIQAFMKSNDMTREEALAFAQSKE